MEERFWEKKNLAQMNVEEWDALCDGCGQCCLEKLMFEETGQLVKTTVTCRFLDIDACRCRIYAKRYKKAGVLCVKMTPENIGEMYWLPETCAYRRIAGGKSLDHWHPLVSGDPESVHESDVSVRGKVVSGRYVHPDDLETYRIYRSEK